MVAVSDESQAIGEFLDWLTSPDGGDVTLGEWMRLKPCTWTSADSWQHCTNGRAVGLEGEDGGPCPNCDGEGTVERVDPLLVPAAAHIETLLARYFDIDMAKVDKERRALLAALQPGAVAS